MKPCKNANDSCVRTLRTQHKYKTSIGVKTMATIRYQSMAEYNAPQFPVCIAIRDYE